MPELTSERLAELREMHKQLPPGAVAAGKNSCETTLSGHYIVASEESGPFAYAGRTESEFIAAFQTSASDLFDLAQEALEKREAEKCQACKGVGAPWNNSSSVACDSCNGTGKNSPAAKEIVFDLDLDFRGEFDETWLSNANVHIERMNETAFWIGFDMPGDKRVMLNTGVYKGVWYFNLEEDKLGTPNHVSVQRPRNSKPVASLKRQAVKEKDARIAELRAELDRDDKGINAIVDRLISEAAVLREKLAAAEKDTARLDWWQKHPNLDFICDAEEGEVEFVISQISGGVNDREWHEIGRGLTLRAAIDAARAAMSAADQEQGKP